VKFSHTRFDVFGPELIPVCRQPAGDKAIHPAVGCHYFPPGLQLPSQLKSVAAHRPVSNYAAWRQRQMCVSSHLSVSVIVYLLFLKLLGRPAEISICFSGSLSLCFMSFTCHSIYVFVLHSWLNRLIDWPCEVGPCYCFGRRSNEVRPFRGPL